MTEKEERRRPRRRCELINNLGCSLPPAAGRALSARA